MIDINNKLREQERRLEKVLSVLKSTQIVEESVYADIDRVQHIGTLLDMLAGAFEEIEAVQGERT